jgi:hypothetical protein
MSDKRPRVTLDLDPDIAEMIEEERRRAREEHFLELSQAAAAKALLKKLRAMTRPAPPPASAKRIARSRPRLEGELPSAGYSGPLPRLLVDTDYALYEAADENREDIENVACDLDEAA